MGIVVQDIQKVKESADLVALISEHVPLKRAGRRYTGCCPFHEEKTPSFSVNPELGFYYCFGCQKKGDAITFLREFLNMEFSEAVEFLAKKSNIELHYDNNQSTSKKELSPLYEALDKAKEYYHSLLKESESAKVARQYVRSRGFGKEAVEQFAIGYAPDGYDLLAKKLSPEFSDKTLIEAGLCYKNSRGKLNDVFRNRLIFPIANTAGATIGFGARTLDGTPPKYKNTSETKLYRKSSVLYNIDKAKSAAVKDGYFVVCEGYTDVIAMSLSGVAQAVATCGTAATIDHVRIMSKFVKKIILCFDADSAGQKATERWLEFLTQTESDIYVCRSSSFKDPADLYKEDPALLPKMIEDSVPFLEFLLQRIVDQVDSQHSIEERARIAQQVVSIIRKHPSSLVREGYVMQFAPNLGFEPDWFFQQLSRPEAKTKERVRDGEREVSQQQIRRIAPPENIREDLRQRELLRLCVHEPHIVARYIRGDVFTHPLYREIFDALIEHESIEDALMSLREEAQEVLTQILVEDIENIEEVSPYSLDVFSRVVVSQMNDFLHQLVAQGADNTAHVKRLIDQMTSSIEKGDQHALTTVAHELLDIRSSATAQETHMTA
jgi:DNA primase